MDQIATAADEASQGKVPSRPVIEMTLPSTADASLVPPHSPHHIAQLFVQYCPYKLREGCSWEDERFKESVARRVFSFVDEAAPGFSQSVLHMDILSPRDLERDFGLHQVRMPRRPPERSLGTLQLCCISHS